MKNTSPWWPSTLAKLQEVYYASSRPGHLIPPLFIVKADFRTACSIVSYRVLHMAADKMIAKSTIFSGRMGNLKVVRENWEDLSMASTLYVSGMDELVLKPGLFLFRARVNGVEPSSEEEGLMRRLMSHIDPTGVAYHRAAARANISERPSALRFHRDDLSSVVERVERIEWISSGN